MLGLFSFYVSFVVAVVIIDISIIGGIRKLILKFGQNWASKSLNIKFLFLLSLLMILFVTLQKLAIKFGQDQVRIS